MYEFGEDAKKGEERKKRGKKKAEKQEMGKRVILKTADERETSRQTGGEERKRGEKIKVK